MIGTKIYKKEQYDEALYIECANWCNENNAYIKDMGTHYEVIEKDPIIINYEQVYQTIINDKLDEISHEKLYASAADTISYINSTNEEYRQDALAMLEYRDSCREIYINKIQAIKESSAITLIDPLDILLELPVFSWRKQDEISS